MGLSSLRFSISNYCAVHPRRDVRLTPVTAPSNDPTCDPCCYGLAELLGNGLICGN